MRILHVTTFLHPERLGGAERVVAALARAQAARGHEVTVLTSSEDDRPSRYEQDGVEVVRYFLPGRLRGARFLIAVVRQTRSMLRTVGDRRFDVLHAHQVASAWPALSTRLDVGARVLTFYAPYAEERAVERGTGSTADRVARRAAGWLDRRCLRRADLVHVLSAFSAEQVETLVPGAGPRVAVVPPGVDERFRLDASEPERPGARRPLRLLTVRRLVKRMGLDDLVAAIGTVRAARNDVRLDIVGEGPEERALGDAIRAAGLEEHVTLVGRVPEAALPDRYRAADLFVLPTRALEGYGMATLEALACGVPVVGTTVGATPEVLARWLADAPCVAPGAETLAAGITDALARLDELTKSARAAARALAAEADWSAAADRVVALYRGAR